MEKQTGGPDEPKSMFELPFPNRQCTVDAIRHRASLFYDGQFRWEF
jgi:hypothetical protein